MKPTLNAGCGVKRWGDIRVDVERHSSILYLEKTSANVIADIQFLPFKNESFSETRCFHVLEHVDNPRRALIELKRVSDVVIIRVPVWHFYNFLIEAISLFVDIFFRPRLVPHVVREIRRWKKRYGTHKWYIRLENAKINRLYGVPKEYEKLFVKEKL